MVIAAACTLCASVPAARADITQAQTQPHSESRPAAGRPQPRVTESTLVLSSTQYVESIAVSGNMAWVATRGGIELYALPTLDAQPEARRVRVYTTLDGLAAMHVHHIRITAGAVIARTQDSECVLPAAFPAANTTERISCTPAPRLPVPAPALSPSFAGARITARATSGELDLIGTAGQGVWLTGPGREPVMLTPPDQVCSGHIMAMAEYRGALYLGSFDEGICRTRGQGDQGFTRLDTPFRMVNAMVSTPAGLYVASSSGLFRSVDGERFAPAPEVTERSINGLAFDGRYLYVTNPTSLWRIPIPLRAASARASRPARAKTRQYWRPGRSRALQRVAVGAGAVWLASEDRGIIRIAGDRVDVFDRASGLPTSWIMDIAVGADGTVYAASFRHGLLAISAPGNASTPTVRTLAGLPDSWLLHVSQHSDALWIGTQGGAARIGPHAITTVQEGLPHPCVHAIASYQGRTWLATEAGLYVMP